MTNQPNVLIILTDQQSCWTLGCYGGDHVDTPCIDSLAADGALFQNFFTPVALCTPSRGCMVTGRYPLFHGANQNNLPLNRDEVTFAQILKDQGYDTGYLGKWHLDGTPRPGFLSQDRSMGFDDCCYMFNRGHYKSIIEQEDGSLVPSATIGDEETYTTDFLTTRAIEFIGRKRDQPFLCMLSIPDPHSPFNVRAPYDTMYKEEDMEIPRSFYMENIPDWAEDGEEGRKSNYPLDQIEDSEKKLRYLKSQYCGEVKCIDDNVGRILQALRNKGILNDTIVIFTSDHGEYMGEHGMQYKNRYYETAYRIPLLIRWPQAILKGTVIDPIVTMVDFQQTLLGLIGLAPSGREQGRDASPLLTGEDITWESESYMHPSNGERAGIFTDQYELAYATDKYRDHILFDRKKDPDQMINLYQDPQYRPIVEQLTDRIVQHFQKLGVDKEHLPMAIKSRM